jgi:chromate transporter
METGISSVTRPRRYAALDVLLVFLKLGLTSFGGPVAHIGYFRREFVERRRWLDEEAFTDLVGLCQFLPGPASSQVGFAIGLLRAGWAGGLAAWCGFTLPSAFLLLAFATLAPRLNTPAGVGLVHGLKLVAVAVVAQAVWDMARRLCPDRQRTAIALVAIIMSAVITTVYAQIAVIACGAVLGLALCRGASGAGSPAAPATMPAFHIARKVAVLALALFFVLQLALPSMARFDSTQALAVFNAFYHSGALVFGGGHVILPLLQQQTVTPGWVTPSDFLAGYGAAQAIPGPLSTFAGYLGWIAKGVPNHWTGAALAIVGVFLPGLLLVIATLPYWQSLRAHPLMAAAL